MARRPETYMSPTEFKRIGEKCFGVGWQTRLAQFLTYDRATVNRFAVGAFPIPTYISFTMKHLEKTLDGGEIICYLEPVGKIVDETFQPLNK